LDISPEMLLQTLAGKMPELLAAQRQREKIAGTKSTGK
jgi:hypothetical protein